MAKNILSSLIIAGTMATSIGLASEDAYASSFKIVYTFKGHKDGAQPVSPLININGVLYGATTWGGSNTCNNAGCGTIFSLTTSGTETILHRFRSLSGGISPFGLAQAGNAVMGASYIGDSSANVFSVTTKGKYTLLGNIANPLWPTNRRALTRVGDTWYGVHHGSQQTACGVNSACGYVFAIQP